MAKAKKTAKRVATKRTARRVVKKLGETQLVNVGGVMVEFPKASA